MPVGMNMTQIHHLSDGTDTERTITPDALAQSDFGKTVVTILVTDPNGSRNLESTLFR